MKTQTALIAITDKFGPGFTAKRVRKFAGFDYTIAGRKFRFAVTEAANTLHKEVTHAHSGMRVCALGVGAHYIMQSVRLDSDKARAMLALDALIREKGAERVRDVIAQAETHPSIAEQSKAGALAESE